MFCKNGKHDWEFYNWTFFGYEQECTKCPRLRRHFAIPEIWEQMAVESGYVDVGDFI